MEAQPRRVAVLIDGENIGADHAQTILRAAERLGRVTVRRVYGDFTSGPQKPWRESIEPLALLPVLTPPKGSGKNSADIALVIDAMDLLHSGQVEAFCIASSDSDFSRLALRIRETGRPVLGVGRAGTTSAFRSACTEFMTCGEKTNSLAKDKPAEPAAKPAATSAAEELDAMIEAAFARLGKGNGWHDIGTITQMLKSNGHVINPETYGSTRLLLAVTHSARFEAKHFSKTDARIRMRP